MLCNERHTEFNLFILSKGSVRGVRTFTGRKYEVLKGSSIEQKKAEKELVSGS